MEMRVIAPEEIDSVLAFERDRLKKIIDDDFQRELAEWSAPWRKEALEYYIQLGWSFSIHIQGQLQGYLLAQPLLFFRSNTQTLWVEHMSYNSEEVRLKLVEIAYRWSRDKHLQRVLFANPDWVQGELPNVRESFDPMPVSVRTTKT